MKIVKKKIILSVIIALIGIVLFVVNSIKAGDNSNIRWLSLSLTTISIIKLIQFIKISKNPQLLKKFEIQEKEERFILISEKSGSFTFLATLFVEFIAIFILALINQETMVNIVAAIVGIQTLIYILTYHYLCKKY